MKKLMLNTYAWVALAFYVVALIDLGRDGGIWIVWFALGMVFTVIAYRKPKPSGQADAHVDGSNDSNDDREETP
ncbi:hypothetical protein [Pseudoclavibacter terrae]|uniref:Uncharacterized protein n=1 Tax=Pseudoclavibacter terrae TaxID=1530195 RepID=A0A7J5AXQ2_9MICO|nr:hypothetical protein [Pseudoclavibacter terrae]KAB1636208.1 hypothetical protein F8O03_16935 [Pseudoclavibacter terrae]